MATRSKRKNFADFIEILLGIDFLITMLIYFESTNTILTIIIGGFITAGILIGTILYKDKRRQELINSGIGKVDNMTGEEFEDFLMAHFIKLGYKVEPTAITNDYGADLIVSKGSERIVIQAKRWRKNVGIEAIQQVIGSIKYYKATKGMVITNSYFTFNAENLAKVNDIELWNRDKLIKVMKKNDGNKIVTKVIKKDKENKVKDDTKQRVLDYNNIKNNLERENVKYKCPKCGGDLILRNGRNGKFYGCSSYPKCRFTKNY